MLQFARLLMVYCAVGIGLAGVAQAADSGGATYVVTYIEALPAAAQEAARAIQEFGAASRKEQGNLRFETLQRIDTPNHFVILEAWNDAAALSAHASAAPTKTFRSQLQPLLSAPYDERPHGALSVDVRHANSGETLRGAIFAVTHVDIVPTSKDKGIDAAMRFTEASRALKDNLRFDLLQQSSRPNHMTVVEVWKTQAAVDEHTGAASTQSFRNTLLPMSGSLYDHRLFRLIAR
jgi:quinol monooxygenase YgiN